MNNLLIANDHEHNMRVLDYHKISIRARHYFLNHEKRPYRYWFLIATRFKTFVESIVTDGSSDYRSCTHKWYVKFIRTRARTYSKVLYNIHAHTMHIGFNLSSRISIQLYDPSCFRGINTYFHRWYRISCYRYDVRDKKYLLLRIKNRRATLKNASNRASFCMVLSPTVTPYNITSGPVMLFNG